MAKTVVNEGAENKLYYPKPEITGSEAFIPIMNDMNSGDPVRIARAKDAACAQMERIILYAIKKEGLASYPKDVQGALHQSGFIGVLKAMELSPEKRYNPYQGEPSAFFYKYIKHELLAYINSLGPACTSTHYAQALGKIKKAIDTFNKNNQPYDETVLAQFTGMPLDTVSVCTQILKAQEGSISYSELVENTGSDGSSILGPSNETPEKTAEQEAMKEDILYAIRTTLTDNEKYIVLQFYGFDGDECAKVSTIASDLGISENQVKKLKRKALDKLAALPSIRRWHHNEGFVRATPAAGTIPFFPGSYEAEDDTDFTSILNGLSFNSSDDMVG